MKKFQSALFSPLGRWTGNNFLFKGGLINCGTYQTSGNVLCLTKNKNVFVLVTSNVGG